MEKSPYPEPVFLAPVDFQPIPEVWQEILLTPEGEQTIQELLEEEPKVIPAIQDLYYYDSPHPLE